MSKLVKFKKSLKLCLNEENMVANIVKDVKAQITEENLKHHKNNVQMVLDICNHVEDTVKKRSNGKKQINKKDIVLKVFAELYTDIDLNFIDSSIEALFDNKLIKKSTYVVYVADKLLSFFLAK